MELREKMLAYRAKNNISQAEMAKRCNVSIQTINFIENGKQKPQAKTEYRILNVIKEG